MRSRYKITVENGIYFVTSTIIEWLPVFTSMKYFDIIIKSLQFCKETKGLKLYAYVFLISWCEQYLRSTWPEEKRISGCRLCQSKQESCRID